jgi:hypothetical protein
MIFALAPLAAIATACGGSSTGEGPGAAGASAAGGDVAELAGTGGSIGKAGGGGGGAGGSAAASGGVGDAAGSAGAAGAGTAGASGMGGGGAGGAAGGASGSGGMGIAGMGGAGGSAICHATPPVLCGGGPITLARSCVAEGSAVVGTSLPNATCRIMCESMFTFACEVSAVQAATLTVQCTTGCPATQK